MVYVLRRIQLLVRVLTPPSTILFTLPPFTTLIILVRCKRGLASNLAMHLFQTIIKYLFNLISTQPSRFRFQTRPSSSLPQTFELTTVIRLIKPLRNYCTALYLSFIPRNIGYLSNLFANG